MQISNYDTISARTEVCIKDCGSKRRDEYFHLGFIGRFDKGGDP